MGVLASVQPSRSTVCACLIWGLLACSLAQGQDRAVVAVDDSPSAEQLLSQAEDQSVNNPGESARLLHKVLSTYGRKLVRIPGEADRFIEARTRARQFLAGNPKVLDRYREAHSAEADRIEIEGRDGLLIDSFPDTPAGLRAAIRQSQQALEEAQFDAAQSALDSVAAHPDLATADQGVLLTIRVLVASGLGDRTVASALLAKARESGDAKLREVANALGEVVRDIEPPQSVVVDPLQPSPFGTLPPALVRLWTEPLQDSLLIRLRNSLEDGGSGAAGVDGNFRAERLLVSVPTLVGSTLLINEGYVLRAFDVYSHQPRWYQYLGAPNAPRNDAQAGDLCVAEVAAGRVVALSGHALQSERSGGGRLVCLDLESGAKQWEFSPDRHRDRPEFAGLFLYGAPTIIGDTVIILARKVTSRVETVSSVLGVALDTGDLKFITPAGATPGVRIGGARPFTTPAFKNSWVFVSTGAGATLCLDATNGLVRWLRRDPVPIRDSPPEGMPWEIGGVCVTDRGIFVISPDGKEVQLIDEATGGVIDAIPTGAGTAWGTPRYLLADHGGGIVYSVGNSIAAFRTSDLRSPLWTLDEANIATKDPNDLILETAGRSPIVGRVQSGWLQGGRPALLVPLRSKAVILHGDDGTRLMDVIDVIDVMDAESRGPANMVLRDGVVASATTDTVEVFMDSGRARRILVDAVASDPSDVDAVIGFVEFSMRARDAALLKQAAALAPATLVAVAGDQSRRDRLVALLLDAATSGLLGQEGADSLFAAIASAAAEGEERARVLLAQGDWLKETGRPAAAAIAWRLVLSEPAGEGASIAIAAESGAGVIFESGASAAVERLIALQRSDPSAGKVTFPIPSGNSFEGFACAASSVPGTSAAAKLWLAAAKTQQGARGRALLAAAGLAAVRAAVATGETSVVREILMEAIAILDGSQLPLARATMLDACVLGGFDGVTIGAGGADVAAMLADTPESCAVQGTPLPEGGCATIDRSTTVQGRLMRGVLAPTTQVAGTPALAHAFLIVDRTLTCLAAPDLHRTWTVPLMGEILFVAPAGDRTYIVEHPDRETIDLTAIDPEGHQAWRIEDLAAAVVGETATLGIGECLVLPGARDVVAVRTSGSVASFGADNGARRWLSPRVIDRVNCADAGESLVVIGGVNVGVDEQSSVLVAVDRDSGEVVAQVRVFNDEPLRWVRVVDACTVAFGTTRGVGRWQVFGPAQGLKWISLTPKTRASVAGEPMGDSLFVTDATGRTTIIDWTTGQSVEARYAPPGRKSLAQGRQWRRVGSRLLNWDNNEIALLSLDGAPLGATALHGSRRIESVLPASCAVLAIEQSVGPDEPREFGSPRIAPRTLIHRFGWQDGLKIIGPPIEIDLHDGRLDRAQLVDGWVILGGPQTTTAIPLP